MANIPAQRRTLAMQVDETCTRLEECPTPPVGAVRNNLTGGFVIVADMQRWRCDASGDIIEFTEWKMPTERVIGKSPYKHVWWKE